MYPQAPGIGSFAQGQGLGNEQNNAPSYDTHVWMATPMSMLPYMAKETLLF
jgi:hypothetical protein